jgi:hypothetical protein
MKGRDRFGDLGIDRTAILKETLNLKGCEDLEWINLDSAWLHALVNMARNFGDSTKWR